MKKMFAAMLVVAAMMFSALQAIAGEPQKEPKFYVSAGMSHGYGMDMEFDGKSIKDAGNSISNSSGYDLRFGVTPFSFLSLEAEYSSMSNFSITNSEYNTNTNVKINSLFLNLKLRPVELFVRKPKVSPYFIMGIGTGSFEGTNKNTGESENCDCSAHKKIGMGIEANIYKNLYIYSEYSHVNFDWEAKSNENKVIAIKTRYDVISLGLGIKF